MQYVNLHDLPFAELEYRHGDKHPVHCLSIVVGQNRISGRHVTVMGVWSLVRVVQEFIKLCLCSGFIIRLLIHLCISVLALALAGSGGRGRRSGVLGGVSLLSTAALA